MRPKNQILAWINAYGAQLTSLSLVACAALSKSEFLECLHRLPLLERFRIFSLGESEALSILSLPPDLGVGVTYEPGIVDDEVLERLTPRDEGDGECLLPRLRSLDVMYDDQYPFGRESLVRFVVSRRGKVENRIERVWMYSPRWWSESQEMWEELERRGVDVTEFTMHI